MGVMGRYASVDFEFDTNFCGGTLCIESHRRFVSERCTHDQYQREDKRDLNSLELELSVVASSR